MTAKRPPQASDSLARVSPTAPESKSASANVWRLLESLPGFHARLERGKRQLDEGKRVRFEDRDQ